MKPDHDHADPCRKCRTVHRRSEMVMATKVLRQSTARGYFCQVCAQSRIELEAKLKGIRR